MIIIPAQVMMDSCKCNRMTRRMWRWRWAGVMR